MKAEVEGGDEGERGYGDGCDDGDDEGEGEDAGEGTPPAARPIAPMMTPLRYRPKHRPKHHPSRCSGVDARVHVRESMLPSRCRSRRSRADGRAMSHGLRAHMMQPPSVRVHMAGSRNVV